MNKKKQYVTVQELAELTGKSPASIYKRLKEVDSKLSTYSTKVDNRIMIDISAVSEVYGVEDIQPSFNLDSTFSQPDSTQIQPEVDYKEDYIESLKQTIEDLRQQNNNLTQLLNQQQQLTLNLQQKIELLEEPEEPKKGEVQEEPKGLFKRLFRKGVKE